MFIYYLMIDGQKKKVDPFKSAQQNAIDIYDLAGYNENDYCP